MYLIPISCLCLASHVLPPIPCRCFPSHVLGAEKKNLISYTFKTTNPIYNRRNSMVFDPSITSKKKNSTSIKYDTTRTCTPYVLNQLLPAKTLGTLQNKTSATAKKVTQQGDTPDAPPSYILNSYRSKYRDKKKENLRRREKKVPKETHQIKNKITGPCFDERGISYSTQLVLHPPQVLNPYGNFYPAKVWDKNKKTSPPTRKAPKETHQTPQVLGLRQKTPPLPRRKYPRRHIRTHQRSVVSWEGGAPGPYPPLEPSSIGGFAQPS